MTLNLQYYEDGFQGRKYFTVTLNKDTEIFLLLFSTIILRPRRKPIAS